MQLVDFLGLWGFYLDRHSVKHMVYNKKGKFYKIPKTNKQASSVVTFLLQKNNTVGYSMVLYIIVYYSIVIGLTL